jgi:hypothetical protein
MVDSDNTATGSSQDAAHYYGTLDSDSRTC